MMFVTHVQGPDLVLSVVLNRMVKYIIQIFKSIARLEQKLALLHNRIDRSLFFFFQTRRSGGAVIIILWLIRR